MNEYWYDLSGNDLSNALLDYMKRLDDDQSYRQNNNFKYMRLYGNYQDAALRNYSFYRSEPTAAAQHRVTLNVIQSMIDTVVSKLTKNTPRASFLTDGGDWSAQRRAKKLSQFVDGAFYLANYYEKRAMAIQDSCIFGTGALKMYRDGTSIKLERIFIDELVVDDNESIYGEPRQMHQRKFIHKDVLIAMFPDKKKAIEAALEAPLSELYSNTFSNLTTSQMVQVTESWKLRSSPKKNDGKHAINITGLNLLDEPYDKDYFPFLFWRWTVAPLGFWGQGLAEQLLGIQLEINKILRTIQVSMHLVSVPKLFIEASSKIVSSHLNNKIGGLVKYVGQPPIEGKLGSIPSELFSHLDRLYTRAFEVAGISQLSAMAAKPQGLNSGKALREFNDIESERFMAVAKRDEAVTLQAARMFIDFAKEIAEEEGDYSVKAMGSKFTSSLNWTDINLPEDSYIMQAFPVSALSKTPSGRLQDVQELMSAGLIGKEDGMKLLDFPDLQQYYNFNNAGVEDIERTIERMIDEGDYQTPEPYQNLQLGITKMQQAYLLYRSQGAPDERLELFRRWIEEANGLIKKAQQEIVAAQQQAQMQAEAAQIAASAPPAPVIPSAPVQSLPPETQTPILPTTE